MDPLQKDPFPWLPKTSTRRHTFKGEHLYFMKNDNLLKKYNDKLSTISMQKKMSKKYLINPQDELINDFDYTRSSFDEKSEIEIKEEKEKEEEFCIDEWEIVEGRSNTRNYFSEAHAWVVKCIYA